MDYKKAYEQDLERARKVHQGEFVGEFHKENLEQIFPELKESEDEKIRKYIIHELTCLRYKEPLNEHELSDRDIELRNAISWLENLKEYSGLTKDEEFTLNRIIEHFEEEGGYDKWIEVLQDIRNTPYQKQQKEPQVKVVSLKFRVGDTISNGSCIIQITSMDDKYYWHNNDTVGGDIESIDKEYELVEQNTTWSEEDEKMIRSICYYLTEFGNLLSDKNEEKSVSIYKAADWIKSLKPQPKQDWSEKDAKILNKIIDELTPYGECPDYPSPGEQEYYYTRTSMIDWLKSIKNRVLSQPKQERSSHE